MKPNPERKFVLYFAGAVLLVIASASLLAPPSDDSDPVPTTYNSGTAGAKAAFLLLSRLGFDTARWSRPTADLATLDAPRTTLIFAEPDVPSDKIEASRADIAAFLHRGGRVFVTGPQVANLLPNAATDRPTQPFQKLCVSTPEGRGPLARAGPVSIADHSRWTALTPLVHVQQWCGADAVVVTYPVGPGTAVWWSSPLPLTNQGLKEDPSLNLLLASIGTSASGESSPRPTHILFDEYFHGVRTSLFDLTRGLPLPQLAGQTAAVALLLVLSFGRRNGPLRQPARVPRTSPIEFAESMGQLYRKANATQAATESARHRLLTFLVTRCGLPRALVRSAEMSPAAIAEALAARFPGDWSTLAHHLTQAAEAEYQTLSPRAALALVQALDHDLQTLTTLTTRTPTAGS